MDIDIVLIRFNKQAFLCERTKGESNMINKEQLDLLYKLKKKLKSHEMKHFYIQLTK